MVVPKCIAEMAQASETDRMGDFRSVAGRLGLRNTYCRVPLDRGQPAGFKP